VDLGHARLRALPSGGRTPLAAALRLAHTVLASDRARGAGLAPVLVLVSDGRANVADAGGDPTLEALAAARALAAAGVTALVVDAEDGPVRLGLAQVLGAALAGPVVRLADLAGDGPPGPLPPLAAAALGVRGAALGSSPSASP
jgi:magnesium chelatase subunit D